VPNLKDRQIRLAYQPPHSSTFLSEQTSQQYFSLRTNQHQPPVKRTGLSTLLKGDTTLSSQVKVVYGTQYYLILLFENDLYERIDATFEINYILY
jgi:hypothetical protein